MKSLEIFTEENRQKYRDAPYHFSEEFIDGIAFSYKEMHEEMNKWSSAFKNAEWGK